MKKILSKKLPDLVTGIIWVIVGNIASVLAIIITLLFCFSDCAMPTKAGFLFGILASVIAFIYGIFLIVKVFKKRSLIKSIAAVIAIILISPITWIAVNAIGEFIAYGL